MADPLGGPVGIPLIGPVTSYSRPTDPLAPMRDMMAKMAMVAAPGLVIGKGDAGPDILGEKPTLRPLAPPDVPIVLAGAHQLLQSAPQMRALSGPLANATPLSLLGAGAPNESEWPNVTAAQAGVATPSRETDDLRTEVAPGRLFSDGQFFGFPPLRSASIEERIPAGESATAESSDALGQVEQFLDAIMADAIPLSEEMLVQSEAGAREAVEEKEIAVHFNVPQRIFADFPGSGWRRSLARLRRRKCTEDLRKCLEELRDYVDSMVKTSTNPDFFSRVMGFSRRYQLVRLWCECFYKFLRCLGLPKLPCRVGRAEIAWLFGQAGSAERAINMMLAAIEKSLVERSEEWELSKEDPIDDDRGIEVGMGPVEWVAGGVLGGVARGAGAAGAALGEPLKRGAGVVIGGIRAGGRRAAAAAAAGVAGLMDWLRGE